MKRSINAPFLFFTQLTHSKNTSYEQPKKPLPKKWLVRFSDYRDVEDYLISKYGRVDPYIIHGFGEKILLSEDNPNLVSPKYTTGISLLKHIIPNYQEITMEQFKQHFSNTKLKTMTDRFPFKLEQENAKRIIAIACQGWKNKLSDMWGKELLLTGYINISEEFYKEMRKACTQPQHELFDQIFGKDEVLKPGDIVVVTKKYGDNSAKPGQVVKLLKMDTSAVPYFVEDFLKKYNWNEDAKDGTWCCDVRLATEEEITEASTSPYKDGELVFVKCDALEHWLLRYTTGKLKSDGLECYNDQQKLGMTTTWEFHAPLSSTLPK